MEKPRTISFVRKQLPHWDVVDGRYFITIRLKGAIPKEGMQKLSDHRRNLEELTGDIEILHARRKIFREMENWLELAPAVQHLINPAVAKMVMESLHHRHDRGTWQLLSYIIMPNHLHFFVGVGKSSPTETTRNQSTLIPIIRDFKRWTATQAGRILEIDGGNFWQREWFDHWSRSPQHDEGIRRYIRNNAVKAGLAKQPEDWPYFWESPKVGNNTPKE